MDIDLDNKNVTELSFQDCAASEAESAAARAVLRLSAAHNRISSISGLGSVFSQLVELHLSHNNLGATTSAPSVTMSLPALSSSSCCDGVASWIKAFPPTLEVIDLSYNHLNSLAQCTCSSGSKDQLVAAPSVGGDEEERAARYRRHLCPMAVSLFFPRSAFPRLRVLNLSHNALAVSLRESDEMEKAWHRVGGAAAASSSIAELDVSHNMALFSVNCLLLSVPLSSSDDNGTAQSTSPLVSLHVQGSGIEDLAGLSAVSLYAPNIRSLQLHPSPISQSILYASKHVVGDLLESLLVPMLSPPSLEGEGPTFAQEALSRAVQELTHSHMDEIHAATQAAVQHSAHTCVYAALLQEVIPGLQTLDTEIDVLSCKDCILNASQSILLSLRSSVVVQAAPITPPSASQRQGSFSDLAATVVPNNCRARIIVSEADTAPASAHRYQDVISALQPLANKRKEEPRTASQEPVAPSNGSSRAECFTPCALSTEDRRLYEELCHEAKRMEQELADTQQRTRDFKLKNEELKGQLSADRNLIADQRRQLAKLREQQQALHQRTQGQKKRLKKMQLDASYGVQAIQSKVASSQQQAAAKRLEERERAVQKKERELRKRMALAEALSVQYKHVSSSTNVPRSVALRDAAVKKRISEQSMKDALLYTPLRFRPDTNVERPISSDQHAPFPSASSLQYSDLEAAYFKNYHDENDKNAEEKRAAAERVAAAYCARLPDNHRDQLREAVRSLSPPQPARRGMNAAEEVEAEETPSPLRKPPLMPPPPLEAPSQHSSTLSVGESTQLSHRDLSSMSLSELFEAAATIRRKQLALQQLQGEESAQPQRRDSGEPPLASLSQTQECEEDEPTAVMDKTQEQAVSDAKNIYAAILEQQRQQQQQQTEDYTEEDAQGTEQTPSSVAMVQEEECFSEAKNCSSPSPQGGCWAHSHTSSTEDGYVHQQPPDQPTINRALFSA